MSGSPRRTCGDPHKVTESPAPIRPSGLGGPVRAVRAPGRRPCPAAHGSDPRVRASARVAVWRPPRLTPCARAAVPTSSTPVGAIVPRGP
ncbi:hypothetical protein GCM10017752_54740 [Streptomyces roseoviridis]